MKKLLSILALLFTLSVVPTITTAAPLQEMKDLIRDEYYGELPSNWDEASSIEELVKVLDPYSTYMTAAQYQNFYNAIDSQSVGIGIVIETHEQGILVTQVVEDANAQKAGVEAGDIITHVNGVALNELSIEEGAALIQGEAGTIVNITLLKQNGIIVKKAIERHQFSIPNAQSKLLANNVGYISLNSFSQNAATLIKNEYVKLANNGATSFILDLQNNTGGYVNAAENVIGLFQHAPHAYVHKTANGERKILAHSQPTKLPENTRVLINGYSASASEMVAAALKDQQAATLYGQRTYGKGVMQAAYTLSDGSYFKLTVAEFLGPHASKIQLSGIMPHIQTNGDPLYRAHFDAIVEQLDQYRALPELTNVPVNKTFTMTFNNTVQANVAASALQLIELGEAKTVPLTVHTEGKQLLITPQQPLKAKQQYALLVHPTITNSDNKALNRGYYMSITVQ